METWQILLVIASSLAFAVLLFYLVFFFLTKPRKHRPEMDAFRSVRYAHRGLHWAGAPENSLSAFKAAVDAGYGIELDVRLSSDGELVVFHDATLDRMTGEKGKVNERTLEELRTIRLGDSSDTVPAFRDVLRLVDGKVPLLVEIKEEAGEYGVSEKTVEILREYKGAFIVESFNPLALRRVKKLAPEIIRGFLSQNFWKQKKYRTALYFLVQNMLFNCVSRPDFIAFCHEDADMRALKFIKRHHKKTPLIAWTVESARDDAVAVKNGFSGIIFQNYYPETSVSGEGEVV